jgi:predicted DNA-binding transcriptional regulator YafY
MNKLRSFSENPSRYARGGVKAKEKVDYLENIKDKFSEGQLATYLAALKEYESSLNNVKEFSGPKKDYAGILLNALNLHKSIKIKYKGSWRTIDTYSMNGIYLVAYCHLANDIRTFRIDRIQDIEELSDNFGFDRSLYNEAQSRIVDAPNYRRYR